MLVGAERRCDSTIWKASPARMCSLGAHVRLELFARHVGFRRGVCSVDVVAIAVRQRPAQRGQDGFDGAARRVVGAVSESLGRQRHDFHFAAHMVEDDQRARNHEVVVGESQARLRGGGELLHVARHLV